MQVVFNSSFSPPGARAPVACYRIPMIEQTADGTLVAFAEARIGKANKAGKILVSSCDDCVVNGIAQRRSTCDELFWGVRFHALTPTRLTCALVCAGTVDAHGDRTHGLCPTIAQIPAARTWI
jgi:hypothetical protein